MHTDSLNSRIKSPFSYVWNLEHSVNFFIGELMQSCRQSTYKSAKTSKQLGRNTFDDIL